jgi:hypothetical protein
MGINVHQIHRLFVFLQKNPQFSISLNYFISQAPWARNSFLDKEKPRSVMILSPPMVEPKVNQSNMLSMCSCYFACTANENVCSVTYSYSIHIASDSNYSNVLNHAHYNSKYVQKPMSTMHSVSFNGIRKKQHALVYPSFIDSRSKSYIPMNNYDGQTSMVRLAKFYETSRAHSFVNVSQVVSSYI